MALNEISKNNNNVPINVLLMRIRKKNYNKKKKNEYISSIQTSNLKLVDKSGKT